VGCEVIVWPDRMHKSGTSGRRKEIKGHLDKPGLSRECLSKSCACVSDMFFCIKIMLYSWVWQ